MIDGWPHGVCKKEIEHRQEAGSMGFGMDLPVFHTIQRPKFDYQGPHKTPNMVVYECNPSAGEADEGGPFGFAAQSF